MGYPSDRVDRTVTFLSELDARGRTTLADALQRRGMPAVPDQFSVVPAAQCIGREIVDDILEFVRVFETVTNRHSWRAGAPAGGDTLDRSDRPETCFFSAWDFHIPAEHPGRWQLIEFNDNGSGFLFAALLNRHFYEVAGLEREASIEAPPAVAAFERRLLALITEEAERFFGHIPNGLFFILDDRDSLREGRFRREHLLLRGLLRRSGIDTEIGTADSLGWSGGMLRHQGREVCFIVNRSTDFYLEASAFAPIHAAYREGKVYVAPNPHTYATRSDKGLLRFLSLPERDEELGITRQERAVLGAHVPETHVLDNDNVDELAARKAEFVFKPMHGYAGRGVLSSDVVGRQRLRRLLRQGRPYVAQKKVSKSVMPAPGTTGGCLWTDLRVWAYRGERWLLSGRASTRPDRLDLTPPGGWLPTYARR